MGGRRPDHSRRQEIARLLREAGEPLGVAEVADRFGVHANTARFHLDALVAEGAAERRLEEPSGPGRPRTVYTRRPGMDRGGVRSYRLLAQVLLSRLAAAGPGAAEDAREAGRAWGRYLAESPPPHVRLSTGEAAGRLTVLLDDLGFAPEPASGNAPAARAPGGGGDPAARDEAPQVIRLRHCPFLELAEEYGSLVCPLHLGLMQGALEKTGTALTATRLEPFAEPDSCLAHLRLGDAA